MTCNINKTFKTTFQLTLLFVLILISITSCEGYRFADGTVVDDQTGLPLDSVLCHVITADRTYLTDETGKFDVKNKMGGCMRHCKDITIEFSKNGYHNKTLTNPKGNVTVRMTK